MMPRWRIPDWTGGKFAATGNLCEIGVGGDAKGSARRFLFTETLVVGMDNWLEVEADGEVFICTDDSRTKVEGTWEPMEHWDE